MSKTLSATLKKYIRDNYVFLLKRDWTNKHDKFRSRYRDMINAYDGEYLTCREYANIRGLYFFLKDNEDLTIEQVEDIIRHYNTNFEFLNNFLDVLPSAIQDLNQKGPHVMATKYISISANTLAK